MKIFSVALLGIIIAIGVSSFAPSYARSHDLSLGTAPSLTGLGHIEFPTSTTSEEAQKWFLRGVLLLHSFEYDDAKDAFQEAQTLDPDFAMAYWGEAMTENHPLWLEQYKKKARAILKRLGPTKEARLAKAPTQREKGYLQAIEFLYGDGDKVDRDLAYMAAMRKLSEDFPEDQEASAFYALALLGSRQGQRDFRTYMQAAAIAEEIFQKNPRHPGAVHYLIHSYDDPIHAPLGLRAARVYGSLAPAASHAQHMPSHIFMSLGMWDEVVKANKASWASSEARLKAKGLTHEDRPYHTLHWLEYAYLQQGRDKEAKALLTIIEEDAQSTPTTYVRGYLASMSATYTVETRHWDVRRLSEDRSGLRFSSAASDLFAIGMSGVKTHRPKVYQQALLQLKELMELSASSSTSTDDLAGMVMAKELEGLVLLEEGKEEKGLRLLGEATELEDQSPYAYGPPFPVKPAHELLGEILLEFGQKEKAKEEFELALDRAPRRALSLEGLGEVSK